MKNLHLERLRKPRSSVKLPAEFSGGLMLKFVRVQSTILQI